MALRRRTIADANQDADKLTLSMSLTVPSGAELHQCQLVALPSPTDIEASASSHEYTAGSHHFLLFETNLDSIPPDLTGQYDCTRGDEPVMQHATGILYGGQSPKGQVTLPTGVGLKVKANQVFMMQAHYLNPSSKPIDAHVSMSFTKAATGSITTEAGFLIFYDPFIYLPPQGTASSAISCAVTGDITLMYGYTHYHQRGRAMKVWNDPTPTTPAAAPFHETSDWEHPADFAGPLTLAKGSTVRLSVRLRESRPEGRLSRSQRGHQRNVRLCRVSAIPSSRADSLCQNLSVQGMGTDNCLTQAACLQACPADDVPKFTHGGVIVGPCWEKCVASGCKGATDTVLPAEPVRGQQLPCRLRHRRRGVYGLRNEQMRRRVRRVHSRTPVTSARAPRRSLAFRSRTRLRGRTSVPWPAPGRTGSSAHSRRRGPAFKGSSVKTYW